MNILEKTPEWEIFGLLILIVIIVNTSFYAGCCKNNDSYYYMNEPSYNKNDITLPFLYNMFGENLPYFLLGVNILFTLAIYMFLNNYFTKTISFISTILFIIDPINIFFNSLGVVDKTVIVMFLYINILLTSFTKTSFIIEDILKIISLIFLFITLYFSWAGWGFIALIFLIMSIFKNMKNFKRNLLLSIPVFIGFIILFRNKILNIIDSNYLVGELMPIYETFSFIYIFYFIFSLSIIIIFIIILKNKKYNDVYVLFPLFIVFIFTFFMSIFMFRFIIFFIPLFYFFMGFLFTVFKNEKYFKVFIFLSFVVLALLSSPLYIVKPKHQPYKEVMREVNKLDNECIISDWGRGYILQYLTNKTVLYNAHPSPYKLKGIIEAFYLNKTQNCVLIWKMKDSIIFQKYIEHMNLTINNTIIGGNEINGIYYHANS